MALSSSSQQSACHSRNLLRALVDAETRALPTNVWNGRSALSSFRHQGPESDIGERDKGGVWANRRCRLERARPSTKSAAVRQISAENEQTAAAIFSTPRQQLLSGMAGEMEHIILEFERSAGEDGDSTCYT
ncbi:hypothetical protein IVB22_26575 [Bradyrhizobium sp. 190]|uniref:hypothetical protein n=1 Tax=Bradyrhizobium sp. 190 TaxID=2782658 RepID=UPI0035ABD396|nr:hypothetical protein [Bradyrhizobium sp. 190]